MSVASKYVWVSSFEAVYDILGDFPYKNESVARYLRLLIKFMIGRCLSTRETKYVFVGLGKNWKPVKNVDKIFVFSKFQGMMNVPSLYSTKKAS